MTVYRYVRTGRLPGVRIGTTWRVDPADFELVRRGGAAPTERGADDEPVTLAGLEARLLDGDEFGAWELLEASLASGNTPDGLLLELIGPAMRKIGEGWEAGELTVADEHRAMAVALRLISRLGGRFARRGRKRGTVVLATPPGENHSAPVSIVSNLLRWHGYHVVELGADLPVDALADAASHEENLLLVGLAVTGKQSLDAARWAVQGVHDEVPGVPVLLGGAAITSEEMALDLGADLYGGRTGDDVLHTVERLVPVRT
jgi:methanogenic corrinoid protein MtbC1